MRYSIAALLFFALLSYLPAAAPQEQESSSTQSTSTTSSAAVEPPEWLFDLDGVYPKTAYIAAIGSGATRAVAEKEALRILAQQFAVSIETSSTTLFRSESSRSSNSETRNTIEQSAEEQARVIISETLEGVELSAAYLDPDGTTHIVAALNRRNMASRLGEQLDRLITERDLLIEQAKNNELSPIERFFLLSSARDNQQKLDPLLLRLSIVADNQARLSTYTARNDTTELTKSLLDARQQIIVRVEVADATGGIAEQALREAFTQLGLNVGEDGNVSLVGEISISEGTHPRYKIARWNIAVGMQSTDGRELIGFSRNGNSVGPDIDSATYTAHKTIIETINNDFVSILSNGSSNLQ